MKQILFISTLLIFNQSIFAESVQATPSKNPVQLSIDAVQWQKSPRIRLEACELENQSRHLSLQITADPNGKVTDVQTLKSTGLDHLDQKIIKSIFASRFRATKEAITVNQDFDLHFAGQPTASCRPAKPQNTCVYLFESDILLQQIQKHPTPFQYREVPHFYLAKTMLNGISRDVNFSFKLSKNNEISNIKINTSSGIDQIDAQVISALQSTKITSDKKWWQFYKVTHQDHLHFDINKCP